MRNNKVLHWALVGLISFMLAGPLAASAKDGGSDFTPEELAQMLAPVALYPDALLSQVLMAATYPLEVVAADRWVKNNPLLKGDNLDEALLDKDWDASVKALCQVPSMLGVMSERLEDTTRLGDAFINQEKEVMDTVQDLRARAAREGNLKSDDKQTVTIAEDGTIVIASADQHTVYVPYYDTHNVYGPWWYPAWPPWYWGPGEVVLGSGIYFWPDFYFGFGFGFGYWSHLDWASRTIVIDHDHRPHFFRPDHKWGDQQGSWRHEPSHRRGVAYHDRATAERFGQPLARVERAERQSTRSKALGAETAGGVGNAKTEGSAKTGGKGFAGQKSTAPSPFAGDPSGKPVKPSGSGKETGGQDRGTPGRRGGVTAAPNAESSRPLPENPGQDSGVRPEPTRSREYSTDNQGDGGRGGGSQYDRSGGSGREGRQYNTQDRGGSSPEGWGGDGRGERGGRR